MTKLQEKYIKKRKKNLLAYILHCELPELHKSCSIFIIKHDTTVHSHKELDFQFSAAEKH